jgi:ferric-dicitrate binding protein FerR (iron transport regulator)
MGSRVTFSLPDGTTGFLNSGSTLTYTIPFANNRKLELQGEAWFDVAHDEQHPLEIGAGTSAVRVLGTSFNLNAYPNDNFIEVVLAEGKVAFNATPNTPFVELDPEERLVYNGESIHIEKTEPEKFKGWTEGKLIFRGDNMKTVAYRLERWYNIEVEIADQALNEYVFRATFEDDNLPEVLRLLSMTSPMSYRISPRKALPDGSWQKEKVTFYKQK